MKSATVKKIADDILPRQNKRKIQGKLIFTAQRETLRFKHKCISDLDNPQRLFPDFLQRIESQKYFSQYTLKSVAVVDISQGPDVQHRELYSTLFNILC